MPAAGRRAAAEWARRAVMSRRRGIAPHRRHNLAHDTRAHGSGRAIAKPTRPPRHEGLQSVTKNRNRRPTRQASVCPRTKQRARARLWRSDNESATTDAAATRRRCARHGATLKSRCGQTTHHDRGRLKGLVVECIGAIEGGLMRGVGVRDEGWGRGGREVVVGVGGGRVGRVRLTGDAEGCTYSSCFTYAVRCHMRQRSINSARWRAVCRPREPARYTRHDVLPPARHQLYDAPTYAHHPPRPTQAPRYAYAR